VAAPRRPERTCVGCRQRGPKSGLLRLAVASGSIAPDPSGVVPGRGAYVHRVDACVDAALARGAVARALRTAGEREELGRLRVAIEGVLERG
jgi:uncharacterized protein